MKNLKPYFYFTYILIIFTINYCSSYHIKAKDSIEKKKYINLFKETYYKTLSYYYNKKKKLSSKKMFYGALDGMFKAIKDPHTIFLNEQNLKLLKESTAGIFAGLGFKLLFRNKEFVILYTLAKSPAEKVGIKSRDRLIKINNQSIKKWSIVKVITTLRGKKKSKIKLKIKRLENNQEKYLDFLLERKIIKLKIVESQIMQNKIAYLKLKQFNNFSSEFVKSTLLNLKKQKIKALIFDLRSNPGGKPSECLKIINYFLGSNKKMLHIQNKKNIKSFISKKKFSIYPKLPLAILANKNSASASEIFIGAIKDHKRGIIIGQKTYGKGSVQFYIPSSIDSSVGFKITKSLWLTPNFNQINQKGINPDIQISTEKFSIDEKYQINKLKKTRLIEHFVSQNHVFSKKKIKNFIINIKKKGIKLKSKILIYLLKKEKYLFHSKTVLDLNYDKSLKVAFNYLKNILKKNNFLTF